jgi:hypothetical protein
MAPEVQTSHPRAIEIATDVMQLSAIRTAGPALRFGTVQRAAVIAAGLVTLAGAVRLVWVAPWIGLAVAVGSAMAWCAWLARHPERADHAGGVEDGSLDAERRVSPYPQRTGSPPTVR